MKRWLYTAFALPAILLLLLLNIRLFSPGDQEVVFAQLEFLEASLTRGE